MSKPFDLLSLFAEFGHGQKLELNNPELVSRFLSQANSDIGTALRDKALLQGLRVERLFESLVRTLDSFMLFKAEDLGKVHSTQNLRAPDFRIVLSDGEQMLIEVKNVYVKNPIKQHKRFSADYVKSLISYANLVGTPLYIAVFWARWGIWTVVPIEEFISSDGSLNLTMEKCCVKCELGKLGDITIGIAPPLRLTFNADRHKPRSFSPNQVADFTIGSFSIFNEEHELTDPSEQKLALTMMEFGGWDTEGPIPIFRDGQFDGLEFISTPKQRSNPNEKFEFIGSISTIHSRYFSSQTTKDGSVIQLQGTPVSDWFEALKNANRQSSSLPLWLFHKSASGAVN